MPTHEGVRTGTAQVRRARVEVKVWGSRRGGKRLTWRPPGPALLFLADVVEDGLDHGGVGDNADDAHPSTALGTKGVSGRPGRLPAQAPHGSGRADLPHPAPQAHGFAA